VKKFIETIRFENGEFHLLDYHQERIDRTYASFYSGHSPIQLTQILPEFYENGKYKFQLEYDLENHQLTNRLYTPKTIRTLQLMEADLDYGFKFSDRSELQKLLDKSKADEIILVKNGLITDTSYSNLAFYDGSAWWTPEQPLLAGVRRSSLMSKCKLRATNLRVDDLPKFSKVSLINALLDLGELSISARTIS